MAHSPGWECFCKSYVANCGLGKLEVHSYYIAEHAMQKTKSMVSRNKNISSAQTFYLCTYFLDFYPVVFTQAPNSNL